MGGAIRRNDWEPRPWRQMPGSIPDELRALHQDVKSPSASVRSGGRGERAVISHSARHIVGAQCSCHSLTNSADYLSVSLRSTLLSQY